MLRILHPVARGTIKSFLPNDQPVHSLPVFDSEIQICRRHYLTKKEDSQFLLR